MIIFTDGDQYSNAKSASQYMEDCVFAFLHVEFPGTMENKITMSMVCIDI